MPHMALTLVPSPTPIPQIITDTVSTSSRMSFHNINHSTIEAEHQQQQHNCKATVISSALEDHESTLHTSLCSHLLNCHPSPRSTTSSSQSHGMHPVSAPVPPLLTPTTSRSLILSSVPTTHNIHTSCLVAAPRRYGMHKYCMHYSTECPAQAHISPTGYGLSLHT